MSALRLGFVGAGQMARAMGFPLIQKGFVKASAVTVSSPENSQLSPWEKYGCSVTDNNGEVVENSDTIIWAVKPQVFSDAVEHVVSSNQTENRRKCHISIMAGVPLGKFTEALKKFIPSERELCTGRVMPNIAMKVGEGCAVYTMDSGAMQSERTQLVVMLSTLGLCYEVPEAQINAYCALFSSGIGFMFPVMEAMADGAVKVGIPRDMSIRMAAQAMKGAATLILSEPEGSQHPSVLKDTVCSPGGTTITGISTLERFAVRNAFIEAIFAATAKGEELGRDSSHKST